MANKVWWIKDGKLGIGSLSNGKITNLAATTGSKIKVHFYKKPTAFTTTLSETPEYPSQFHEALIFKVMQRLAAQEKDFKMSSYWRSEYREMLREAKRYVNKGRVSGYQGVRLVDH